MPKYDDDPMIKLRSMIANLSLADRIIRYPMNRPSPNKHLLNERSFGDSKKSSSLGTCFKLYYDYNTMPVVFTQLSNN